MKNFVTYFDAKYDFAPFRNHDIWGLADLSFCVVVLYQPLAYA